MKNKISSIGKPQKYIPNKYLGLKFHTPIDVKTASHIINTIATMMAAGKKYFHFL